VPVGKLCACVSALCRVTRRVCVCFSWVVDTASTCVVLGVVAIACLSLSVRRVIVAYVLCEEWLQPGCARTCLCAVRGVVEWL